MPPQQSERLLDRVHERFGFGAHGADFLLVVQAGQCLPGSDGGS
jgi:hypothetical protein